VTYEGSLEPPTPLNGEEEAMAQTCPHGYDGNLEASADDEEISSCCGAPVTFRDDGYGDQVLTCKCCYALITGGTEVIGITIYLDGEA
jgi:hypothetical protein